MGSSWDGLSVPSDVVYEVCNDFVALLGPGYETHKIGKAISFIGSTSVDKGETSERHRTLLEVGKKTSDSEILLLPIIQMLPGEMATLSFLTKEVTSDLMMQPRVS